MSGALEKVKAFFGMDSFFEEEDIIDEPRYAPRQQKVAKLHDYEPPMPRKNKVININTTAILDVVIVTPENFEEAQDIADNIKAKRPCVMNLELVDKAVARRIVDFLSGTVYAVDGNIQKVSNGIFLITPYNVNIMGDFRDELKHKGLF
ncbi:MAG: cell division protein SepF [Oscillospiraceae bacterium]|nr:cell division protein SepF [Oscillospiraceae bacterium]